MTRKPRRSESALRPAVSAARPTPPEPSAPASNAARPPAAGTAGDVSWLLVRGARQNNLKDVSAAFPLGRFTVVTGVSGSGKSSLVNEILYAALARDLNGAATVPGEHERIEVLAPAGTARPPRPTDPRRDAKKSRRPEPAAATSRAHRSAAALLLQEHLDKIIAIDQTPIGRTPRSNPATYIKVFDEIRDLFAKLPDAQVRGYGPGRFSFNVSAGMRGGGRCEACEGNGANKIEMDFLADVWVTCPVCAGKRFQRETLQIHFKGRSIADVLEMDVQQALVHFDNVPRIRGMLQTLHDVGLDYIKLGQASPTLSGGEAQRVKLARELVKKPTGRTVYVLDEPTTGLHFEDIRKLLVVLHAFVDAGNTVIVIEHNLDVIKTADWLIDMGPEGGDAGGRVIACGPPEILAEHPTSYTGAALRNELQRSARGPRPPRPAPAAEAAAAPASTSIRVRGARQNNLKDVSVEIPRDQLTVCSGVSGSGKTSFAIDTVFTEGYRRYVESLSAYARQFLGQLQKPALDHVEGLSPAICIEQKSASKSPRSTVGTITEIYDYMRVLWARVGRPHCHRCDAPIGSQTIDEIVARVMSYETGTPLMLLGPVTPNDGETYGGLFQRLKNAGYLRVRVNGEVLRTEQAVTIDARRRHKVEVVVDRTIVKAAHRARISEAVEHALTLGDGVMRLVLEAVETVHDEPGPTGEPANGDRPSGGPDGDEPATTRRTPERELMFSQRFACARCGESYDELGPNNYSFNSAMGWCETCEGLGVQRGAPQAAIIRRPDRSLFDGAISGWPKIERRSPLGRLLAELCRRIEVAPDTPLYEWNERQKQVLMFGTRGEPMSAADAYPGLRFHWKGFFPALDAATRNNWEIRWRLQNLVTDIPCTVCRGGRLRPDAAATRLGQRTLVDLCHVTLTEAMDFFRDLTLDERERRIAGEVLLEIRNRLQFLIDVGLEYLTLHRSAPTLSGGEAQRIRLASQIGSGLSGVLYVLDEPTIGLHPRDTHRLIAALHKLRDLGNTLLLVEHDREVIRAADRIVDFGPLAGHLGGEIVAQGPAREFGEPLASPVRPPAGTPRPAADAAKPERSLTRAYLTGRTVLPIPSNRRPVVADAWRGLLAARDLAAINAPPPARSRRTALAAEAANKDRPGPARAGRFELPPHDPDGPLPGWLLIRGARQNNLANLDVPIPLGRLVAVTGVSGSGKSSLVNDILWPALANRLMKADQTVGEHDAIELLSTHGDPATPGNSSAEAAGRTRAARREPAGRPDPAATRPPRSTLLDKVINCDQSPIGATPVSNPATYTGLFDVIRELFARLPDAKVRGFESKRFSFNRPGGRCEACEGYGQKCIEMHFMPDVWVKCEVCDGRRYNPETLAIRFKNRSIADVLDMRVADALQLFENVPKVRRMLQTLADVGLDYVQLGQSATTLSGGEAQRVKLATELGKPDTGRTLYILDEPTTGLHFEDVRKLVGVLQRLVDLGNTVLVVEHNLDVIKSADWLLDLGPEAGAGGGRLVAAGPPEAVARVAGSHTGVALRPLLASEPRERLARFDRAAHAAEEMAAARSAYGEVGKEVRMPWQVDGRRWHLEQRDDRDGKPRRWEPGALAYVIEQVEKIGGFEPANWNNRASVEVTQAGADFWFLHALTGGEWLLELYFLVPAGTFDARKLNAELGLKTLDQRGDLQTYGNWARVDVRPRRGGVEAVVIYVHDLAEIANPAFRAFLKRAARAYRTL